MTLIAIILAFVLGRLFGDASRFHQFEWFESLVLWLEKHLSGYRIWDSSGGIIVTVAIPLILFAVILHFIHSVLYIFTFVVPVVVLYFCLGYQSIDRSIEIYGNALDDDSDAAAADAAERILKYDRGHESEADFPAVINSLFRQSNERVFTVLFWFVVLGPIGALLVRLVEQTLQLRYDIHGEYTRSAQDLHDILNWPASRLSVLAFAMVGSLIHTVEQWRDADDLGLSGGKNLLSECGLAAIACDPDELDEKDDQIYCLNHVEGLIKRALIFWLVVIAISTISGWLA